MRKFLIALKQDSLTRRLLFVKGIVSVTFAAWWIHPELATPIALMGNMVWLWFTPVLEDKKAHRELAKALNEVRKELDALRAGK